jgi:hypothetical protein
MLNSLIDQLTIVPLIDSIDPTNTAGATSAFVDVSGFEGQVGVVITNGIIGAGGSITWTFETAVDDEGTTPDTIVPLGGALTVASEANGDSMQQLAVFNVSQLQGFLSVVGTVATDAGPISYTLVGVKKYQS